MSRPLVSIVIPTKNRATLMQETLRSLQAQTYDHWEAVVVDDCSSDDTAAVLAKYQAQDARIRPAQREASNGGAPVCRNQGISISQGEYILFLDSDDLLAPGCLASRVEILESEPDLDFVVFLAGMFRDCPEDATVMWNTLPGADDLIRFLSLDAPWGPCCPLWRRVAVERLGPWDERLPKYQDWDYHVRAVIEGLAYTRHEVVDCFVRTAGPERKTISNEPQSDPAYTWLKQLVEKVDQLLVDHPRNRKDLRRCLIGLHYFYLRQLANHSRDQALSAWADYQDDARISWWVYWSGRLHLAVRSPRWARLAVRLVVRGCWPSDLYTDFGSTTFHRAPLGRVQKGARKE